MSASKMAVQLRQIADQLMTDSSFRQRTAEQFDELINSAGQVVAKHDAGHLSGQQDSRAIDRLRAALKALQL